MADAPELAAMIAAVRATIAYERKRLSDHDQHVVALRAVYATLEGIADREWLGSVVFSAAYDGESSGSGRAGAADALRAALLARAGGGNG